MHPRDAPATRHIKHIALAQQLLGPLLAQDGARVDLARHLEGNPRWEVGFDNPGNHIHARPLCRHNNVNPRRARHLRQALDGAFDLFSRHQHEVRHLVHNHHDEGQGRGVERLLLHDRLAGFGVEPGLHTAG